MVCAGLLVYEATGGHSDPEIVGVAAGGMLTACYLVSAERIKKP